MSREIKHKLDIRFACASPSHASSFEMEYMRNVNRSARRFVMARRR